MYYCIIISLNEGTDAVKGGIYLLPRAFTFENYRMVFKDNMIIDAYIVTVARTLVGTAASVLFNAVFAYALSRNELKFRKIYIYIGMFTMYFWGGIIPLYLLIRTLGLIDTFQVHILLNLSGFFTVLIFIAFFREIPSSIIESAKMDGANELLILFRIVLPVSTAVLATVALFSGVGHWNSWIESYLYINNSKLQTLPYVLVRMINQGLAEERMRSQGLMRAFSSTSTSSVTGNSLRLSTMIVSIVPIMLSYPFLQKYFVKGILIGAVKG
jgi:putative aldouronate transport system permease protein